MGRINEPVIYKAELMGRINEPVIYKAELNLT